MQLPQQHMRHSTNQIDALSVPKKRGLIHRVRRFFGGRSSGSHLGDEDVAAVSIKSHSASDVLRDDDGSGQVWANRTILTQSMFVDPDHSRRMSRSADSIFTSGGPSLNDRDARPGPSPLSVGPSPMRTGHTLSPLGFTPAKVAPTPPPKPYSQNMSGSQNDLIHRLRRKKDDESSSSGGRASNAVRNTAAGSSDFEMQNHDIMSRSWTEDVDLSQGDERQGHYNKSDFDEVSQSTTRLDSKMQQHKIAARPVKARQRTRRQKQKVPTSSSMPILSGVREESKTPEQHSPANSLAHSTDLSESDRGGSIDSQLDDMQALVEANQSIESLEHISEDENQERPASTEAVIEVAPKEEVEEPLIKVEEDKPVHKEPEYSVPVTKTLSSDSTKSSKASISNTNSFNSTKAESESDKNPYSGVRLRKTNRKPDADKSETSPENKNDDNDDVQSKRLSVANRTSVFGESKISNRNSSSDPRPATPVVAPPAKVEPEEPKPASDSGSVEDSNEFTAAFKKVRQSTKRSNNRSSPEKAATPEEPEKKEGFAAKKLRPVTGKPESGEKPQPATNKPSWAKPNLAKTPSPEHKSSPVIEDNNPDLMNETKKPVQERKSDPIKSEPFKPEPAKPEVKADVEHTDSNPNKLRRANTNAATKSPEKRTSVVKPSKSFVQPKKLDSSGGGADNWMQMARSKSNRWGDKGGKGDKDETKSASKEPSEKKTENNKPAVGDKTPVVKETEVKKPESKDVNVKKPEVNKLETKEPEKKKPVEKKVSFPPAEETDNNNDKENDKPVISKNCGRANRSSKVYDLMNKFQPTT